MDGNNRQNLLSRFLPASNHQRQGLFTWTQLIDLVIGFFLVLPQLNGISGIVPILLCWLAIVVAVMALYLLATNNQSFRRTWYRTRNAYYISIGILYILPIVALFVARGTLDQIGASFGPLLLSVHMPIFVVALNLVLSHFIGRRLNNSNDRSRQQGYEQDDGIELMNSTSTSMFGKRNPRGGGGKGGGNA